MLVHIPGVLEPGQLSSFMDRLHSADAPWVDGRATAGHQGAQVKRNEQIAEGAPLAVELGGVVEASLRRNPLFVSAALPDRLYPPMFNRYEGGMQFGNHVDGAVRLIPGTGMKLRTDVSVTLFISSPDEYDGGELIVEDTYGVHSAKLPAGDMVVYPASSLHRVAPVTRGARIASFFWAESLVRDDAQRTLLFDLDSAIQRLTATGADEAARTYLTGCYHNLLRMWGEP